MAYEKLGPRYTILGQYVDSHTQVDILHHDCGKIWKAYPNNIRCGARCLHCFGKKRLTHEKFVSQVAKAFGDRFKEYEILGRYVNDETKVTVRHKVCGRICGAYPNNLKKGYKCGLCTNSILKTHDIFMKELMNIPDAHEYEFLEKYDGARKPILVRHKVCGFEYRVSPDNFKRGKRCPCCKESKGEKRIARYLTSRNINHEREFAFDDCVDIRPLRFDFCVTDQNKKIVCLIEYDGEQHYIATEMWGGEEGLRGFQRRDQIKNDYCAKRNIPLIRIPYREFKNIEKILDEKLLPLLRAAQAAA